MDKKTLRPWEKVDTFCPAPWIEAHIAVTGDVYPCCYYDIRYPYGNVKTEKFTDLLNNSKAKNIRKELSEGIQHFGCNNCWRDEKIHGTSYRKSYIEGWNTGLSEPLANTDSEYGINTNLLQKLDLRFDNKCNLKCRICGPMYSTSWFKDAKELKEVHNLGEGIENYEYSISIDEDLFQSLLNSLSSIRLLFFAGGEPLIQDKHYQILEYAIEKGYAKDISIQYNTNFSKLTYKHYKVTELWKHFKSVVCVASLDDSGKRGEYHRKNLVWSEVLKNRVLLLDLPNVEFGLNITVSIYNVIHVLTFIEEWVKLGYLNCSDGNVLQLNILHGPLYLDIVNLPDRYKEQITTLYLAFYRKYKTDARFTDILPHLIKVTNHIKQERTIPEEKWEREFSIQTNVLDRIRNEKFIEIFPEYKDLIEST